MLYEERSMQAKAQRQVSTEPNLIGPRLKYEMTKRGVSSAKLAKDAGVKTSFIYDIISGKSANPSTVKLARVADSLGVSLTSLVDSGDPESEASYASRLQTNDYVTIPRITVDLSSGKPAVISMHRDGEAYCYRKDWIKERLGVAPTDLRLMQMRGDSMEPTFYNNELLLVDITKKLPTPPGLFVIFDGFGLNVKRLEYLTVPRPPRIRIISDNPQYSIYERSSEETVVVGRIVWFSREV
jgi:phage repressor protein C with HTH and peptisase S24 domain